MITRFAPSPTGPLHLGHAYSACLAFDLTRNMAQNLAQSDGTFLLRIEDIDQSRARRRWETQIYDDLAWLGLSWPQPVMRQTDRMDAYAQALDQLWQIGLLYPCSCSRRDIREALSAPQDGAVSNGADGLIYPGTCREKTRPTLRPDTQNLRLDTRRATAALDMLRYTETHGTAQQQQVSCPATDLITLVGDPVLARKDMYTSYHLSVVIDDAAQNITDVVRGLDLKETTLIHVLLQQLFKLPTPVYHHHRLIRDDAGKRLAKRDDARALSLYRAEGATPGDIRALVGLPASFG